MKIIAGHTNMDFDCLASMAAAKLIYKNHTAVIPDNCERMVTEYLKNEDPGFDYIAASEMNETAESAVLVDNDDLSRCGINKKWIKGCKVEAVYDHHPHDKEGDSGWRRKTGANITILVNELEKHGIEFHRNHIRLFLLGLYEDTGMFTYVSLTPEDVQVFSRLMEKYGRDDISYISRYLVSDFNADQLSLLDELVRNNHLLEPRGKKIAVCYAERDEYISNISFVVQRLMFILSVDSVFVVVRLGKHVYLFARSRTRDIDVLKLIERFGGGGHPSAGYVALKEISYVEVRERIMDGVKELYGTMIYASNIMNSEVISLRTDDTVDGARRKMMGYNHSKLPVLDEDGSPSGIITRKEIDRLHHHGMGQSQVGKYINESIITLDVEDGIQEAKKAILEERQSMVLVTQDGKCTGVITKNDLLKSELGDESIKMVNKNMASEVKYGFKGRMYQRIRDIGKLADAKGYRAYIVGGIVRDLIMRKNTFDIDVVVVGNGIDVAKHLAETQKIKVKIHRKFQTATLEYDDGLKIDIATARSETYEKPGALPQVMRSPLKYDLYRRDFTVNAMAIAINETEFGDLYDYFGGYGDIRKKTLKILHTISFIEDPTRILRGVRFASRFGFDFGRQTDDLLKNAIELGVLKYLSGRRVRDELFLIFEEDYPESALEIMEKKSIFNELFPKTLYGPDKSALIRDVRHVLHWYRLLYKKRQINEKFLYLLALFGDMEQGDLYGCAKKFELTKKFNALFDSVTGFIKHDYKIVHKKEFLSNSRICELFEGLSLEALLYLMAKYSKNERMQQYASLYIMELMTKKSPVTGKDLKELGYESGEQIKEILYDIHTLHVDGVIRSKKEAMEYIKKSYPMH